jgi:hypothetical protein
MPRAKLKPTDEDRRKVRSMSACGIPTDEIAKYLGPSEKTLQKYYGKDIFRTSVEANAKGGKTLFEMATGGEEVAATVPPTRVFLVSKLERYRIAMIVRSIVI